jgi:hypothetical protein
LLAIDAPRWQQASDRTALAGAGWALLLAERDRETTMRRPF